MGIGDYMFKLIKRFILILLGIVLILVSLFGTIGYLGYKDAMDQKSLNDSVQELKIRENYTSLDNISTDFLDAIVAIEDHRFFDHGGIDYISLVRITLANLRSNEILGGGSTITQQLAKNFYFMENYNYTRKISEAFVAYQLEKEYDKNDILEMYVNIIYYGDGYYGIKEASLGYFGVEPKDLTLAQASMLAGLPQSPSNYALSKHSNVSYKRQEEVLNAMLKYDYISKEEYIKALATPIYE